MIARKLAIRLVHLLCLLLALCAGCAISGPAEDEEPPDEVYDPNDGEATRAEYTPDVVFLKNNVIGDAALTDWGAMNATQVQAFLQNNPYGWTSVLASHSSDGKSAAEHIVAAAQTHHINPLAILTRVQLEQSLIGKSSAPASVLDKAMGCGCPDNGSCNPIYKGFGKQIDCMASKYRSYLDDLDNGGSTVSGWAVNQSKTTLDGYTVTPENKATAAIYTYTPWVASAKNHVKIWVKYANHVNYQAPQATSSSATSASSSGAGGGGSGGGGGAPTTTQVCYPGAQMNNSACIPLLNRSSSWGAGYVYPSHSSASYQAPTRFIDLQSTSASMQLATNFRLDELMQEHKGRYAMYQPHVVDKLQTIRNQIGGPITVNSGYRNVTYNSGVGGATYSRHMYGDAVDMKSSAASLNTLKARCNALGADYVGMYTNHIHCDWRHAAKDPAFYGTSPMMVNPGEHEHAMPQHDGELQWYDNALVAEATGFDEGEPLREWTALDEFGSEIERAVGELYEPPIGAASVIVEVGGQLVLQTDL